KGWSGVVSLVDVVLGKSDTNSTLDHMFASELEPGVGKIITESWPLLDEFLVRDTTADLEAAAGWEDESPVRRTRLVGAESTVKMSVADERFIEPWAREEVVLQLHSRVVVMNVVSRHEGIVSAEITDVGLVPVAEAQLHRRLVVDLATQ